jgi:hypothetical protein
MAQRYGVSASLRLSLKLFLRLLRLQMFYSKVRLIFPLLSVVDNSSAQIAEGACIVTASTLVIYTLYHSGRAALMRMCPLPSILARNQGFVPWNDPQSCTQASPSSSTKCLFRSSRSLKISLSSCIRSNRWSNQARQGPKSLKRGFPYAND